MWENCHVHASNIKVSIFFNSKGTSQNFSSISHQSTNQVHPKYQICARSGHSSINCYHWMDHSYEGQVRTKKLVASKNTLTHDQTWFIDNNASTHIISNLSNLLVHNEYHGSNQVADGYVVGLSINHIGSIVFHHNSFNLSLNDVLYCPLFSQIFIMCISSPEIMIAILFLLMMIFFSVKDTKTRKMFFYGKSENGMYPLRLSHGLSNKRIFAFIGEWVTSPIWHQYLSHPHFFYIAVSS